MKEELDYIATKTDKVEVYPTSNGTFSVKWFQYTEWKFQGIDFLSQDDLDEILEHIGWYYETFQEKDKGWFFMVYRDVEKKMKSSMAFYKKNQAAKAAVTTIVSIEKSRDL